MILRNHSYKRATLNRSHHGIRRFPTGRVQDVGVVSKKLKTTPTKAARSAFFAKDAKNASFEERAKVKIKILGYEDGKLFGYSSVITTHSKLGAV
ncbi:MAG: hypothetical protein HQL86_07205 [Magnetococcales bacterium]|nr:hypothetical protein [Magnetococcales bacterium]